MLLLLLFILPPSFYLLNNEQFYKILSGHLSVKRENIWESPEHSMHLYWGCTTGFWIPPPPSKKNLTFLLSDWRQYLSQQKPTWIRSGDLSSLFPAVCSSLVQKGIAGNQQLVKLIQKGIKRPSLSKNNFKKRPPYAEFFSNFLWFPSGNWTFGFAFKTPAWALLGSYRPWPSPWPAVWTLSWTTVCSIFDYYS